MSCIKKILVYFLLLNIIGSTLMTPLVYLDFELRRDYIAKVLCINQEKPISVCGGKCYLNERLKDVAENQENQSGVTGRMLEIAFFKEDIKRIDFSQSSAEAEVKVFSPCKCGKVLQFGGSIFRPPQVS